MQIKFPMHRSLYLDDDDDDGDYRLHLYAVNATGEAVLIHVFIYNECSVHKKLIFFSCIS